MILHDLRKTSSSIEKCAILAKHPEVCELFALTYNKSITYGLKFSNIDYSKVGILTKADKEILKDLQDREYSPTIGRKRVEAHCFLYGDLVKLVCNKDLDCGVSATLINSVFKNCVPVFKVQLAKPVNFDKIKFPCLAELKYDGVRIVIIWDGKFVKFYTRNGLRVYIPNVAMRIAGRLLDNKPFILDSEVTLKDGTSEDRTTVSGIINSARINFLEGEDKLVFNVFDTMSLDDFNRRECDDLYIKRRLYLQARLAHINLPYLLEAKIKTLDNKEEVQAEFERVIAQGQEGLILKSLDHKYKFKRSMDWAKIKEVKSADLFCTKAYSGEGKYTSQIGGLTCVGVVEGKDIKVNVGSGLSDDDRAKEPEFFIGKMIEVKYNTIIKDTVTNKWSLFLPRYIQIRFDK